MFTVKTDFCGQIERGNVTEIISFLVFLDLTIMNLSRFEIYKYTKIAGRRYDEHTFVNFFIQYRLMNKKRYFNISCRLKSKEIFVQNK